jgi:hypothetical protein
MIYSKLAGWKRTLALARVSVAWIHVVTRRLRVAQNLRELRRKMNSFTSVPVSGSALFTPCPNAGPQKVRAVLRMRGFNSHLYLFLHVPRSRIKVLSLYLVYGYSIACVYENQ